METWGVRKAAILVRMETWAVRKAAILIRMETWVVRKAAILVRMETWAVRKAAILVRMETWAVRKAAILVRIEIWEARKATILIRMETWEAGKVAFPQTGPLGLRLRSTRHAIKDCAMIRMERPGPSACSSIIVDRPLPYWNPAARLFELLSDDLVHPVGVVKRHVPLSVLLGRYAGTARYCTVAVQYPGQP
jgi:hypothetical protein